MGGRLMRRKLTKVAEVEFDRLDRLEATRSDALLCAIEVTHDQGWSYMPVLVEDYLNCWYWEDVRLSMRIYRHKPGARWEIVPASQFASRAAEANRRLMEHLAEKYGWGDECVDSCTR